MTSEDEPPLPSGRVSNMLHTGKEQRTITNSSRNNEEAQLKQKQHSVSDIPGEESKTQCCK